MTGALYLTLLTTRRFLIIKIATKKGSHSPERLPCKQQPRQSVTLTEFNDLQLDLKHYSYAIGCCLLYHLGTSKSCHV